MKGRGPPAPAWAWAGFALVLLVVLVVRIRLLDVPLQRDEGEYAYAGQLLLQGVPPYRGAYNMKFPGTYAVQALVLALLGQDPRAVHLGLLAVNALTALWVALLARRLGGGAMALAAAACFAVLSLGPSVQGVSANAEHYVLLFAVAGLVALLAALDSGRASAFLGSGVLLGLAVLMKQHGALYLVFALVHLLAARRVLPGVLVACGALLPLAATVALLAWAGVLDRAWTWTIVYAADYATAEPLVRGARNLLHNLRFLAEGAPLPWALAVLGIAWCLRVREARPWRAFLLGLLAASFLATCPGLYFRRHYFVLLLPALSLLAALPLAGASPRPLQAGLLLAALAATVIGERDFFFRMDPVAACRAMYGRNPFPECLELGHRIRAEAAGGDRLAVVGSEPQLYFYTGLRSATGYIYTYALMESHPHALAMQREFIAEVESAAPRWVIVVRLDASWQARDGSHDLVLRWIDGFVRGHDLVGAVDYLPGGQTRVRWGAEAASPPPGPETKLVVYRQATPP